MCDIYNIGLPEAERNGVCGALGGEGIREKKRNFQLREEESWDLRHGLVAVADNNRYLKFAACSHHAHSNEGEVIERVISLIVAIIS